jgi:hypothetical protein
VKSFTASPTRRPHFSLHFQRAGRPLAHVVPDHVWPGMYRVRWADGTLSDMVNLARAKDAAEAVTAAKFTHGNRRLLTWRERTKVTGQPQPSPPVALNPSPLVQSPLRVNPRTPGSTAPVSPLGVRP